MRDLRKGQTDAESLLWQLLRDRRLDRVKFRRQCRIGIFVLDFFAPRLKLAIELDGARHFTDDGRRDDGVRTQMLEQLGIRVIRFENVEVLANPGAALDAIRAHISLSPPLPAASAKT